MRTAVITGGAAGLGLDVARRLSEAGYRIGLFDLGAERVASAAAQLPNAVGIEADITSPEQVAAAFSTFGETPDLLVNNAGIVRFGAMEEQSFQDYIDVVNVNLLGSCFCAKTIAPAMIERGSGHIINFTSINGIHPAPGVGLYGPTKAAMANMTQAMAIEWGPKGIRVNAIAPGYVVTENTRRLLEDRELKKAVDDRIPIGRWANPSDMVGPAVFLASDAARYVNGVILPVDGGLLAQ